MTIPMLDEPLCGYDRSLCRDQSLFGRKVLAMVMGGVFVLLLFYSTVQYRKWKYEQEIAGLQWRIDKKELCPLNSGYNAYFGSRTSLMSMVSNEFHGQIYVPSVADYRGTCVSLKQIVFEDRSQKKTDLSRPIMKEIRKLREIR